MWSAASKLLSSAIGGSASFVPSSYELVEPDPVASGGPRFLWQCFSLRHKTTRKPYSLLIFAKDGPALKELSEKAEREAVVEHMRKDAKALTTMRHPNVLQVVEVVEENSSQIALVTEPVAMSLANACGDLRGLDESKVPESLRDGSHMLSQFEITVGLSHLSGGLKFLHCEAGVAHGDLCPSNIWLTRSGKWKIAGLGFAAPASCRKAVCEVILTADPHERGGALRFAPLAPALEYAAPEVREHPCRFGYEADMWSLGCVVYSVFAGEPLVRVQQGYCTSLEEVREAARKAVKVGGKVQRAMGKVPATLREPMVHMLQPDPVHRPDSAGFGASRFFDEGPVKTLRSVEDVLSLDPTAAATFLSSLPPLLEPFPGRVLRDMVVPPLLQLTHNPVIAPFAVPSLLQAARRLPEGDFVKTVEPEFAKLLASPPPSSNNSASAVQMLLQLAQNTAILMELGSSAFARDSVLPLLFKALDSPVPEVLTAALKQAASVAESSKVPSSSVASGLLPRVLRPVADATQVSVRVLALMALAKLVRVGRHFERSLVCKQVLPVVRKCAAVDKSPAVSMCVLGVLDACAKVLGPVLTAQHVLPLVCPMMVNEKLNPKQFATFVGKARGMLDSVIDSQQKRFSSSGIAVQGVEMAPSGSPTATVLKTPVPSSAATTTKTTPPVAPAPVASSVAKELDPFASAGLLLPTKAKATVVTGAPSSSTLLHAVPAVGAPLVPTTAKTTNPTASQAVRMQQQRVRTASASSSSSGTSHVQQQQQHRQRQQQQQQQQLQQQQQRQQRQQRQQQQQQQQQRQQQQQQQQQQRQQPTPTPATSNWQQSSIVGTAGNMMAAASVAVPTLQQQQQQQMQQQQLQQQQMMRLQQMQRMQQQQQQMQQQHQMQQAFGGGGGQMPMDRQMMGGQQQRQQQQQIYYNAGRGGGFNGQGMQQQHPNNGIADQGSGFAFMN